MIKHYYGSILGYPPLFPRLSSPELCLKDGGGGDGNIGTGGGGGGAGDCDSSNDCSGGGGGACGRIFEIGSV